MAKYWLEALFTKDKQIVDGWCGKDGLLIMLTNDAAKLFLQNRPKRGDSWYFNWSYDRKIAEDMGDGTITANPQLIWEADFRIHT